MLKVLYFCIVSKFSSEIIWTFNMNFMLRIWNFRKIASWWSPKTSLNFYMGFKIKRSSCQMYFHRNALCKISRKIQVVQKAFSSCFDKKKSLREKSKLIHKFLLVQQIKAFLVHLKYICICVDKSEVKCFHKLFIFLPPKKPIRWCLYDIYFVCKIRNLPQPNMRITFLNIPIFLNFVFHYHYFIYFERNWIGFCELIYPVLW